MANGPGFGLYVHIPFCRRKCYYCDFNSYAGRQAIHGPYMEALAAEIRCRADRFRPKVTSVYFGGGDPLTVGAGSLTRLLAALTDRFDVAADAEITLESNPESAGLKELKVLRDAGFNRLSLGFQSVDDANLRRLGRRHSHAQSVAALGAGREAGFDNINVDLINCLPGQTVEAWTHELRVAAALRPDHLSAYCLTLEPDTILAERVRRGEIHLPGEKVQARIYARTAGVMRGLGYKQYEISNFARPGYECRHNLLYWQGGNYLGFGAGAHSHWEGTRWWREAAPGKYIKSINAGDLAIAGSERLTADQRVGETMMLALRLNRGVKMRAIERRFGVDMTEAYGDVVGRLRAERLLAADRGRLRLTAKGRLLANEVAASFL